MSDSILIKELQESWKSATGRPPDTIELLRDHKVTRPEELAEAIRVDLHFRAERGKLLPLEAYLEVCPSLSNRPQLLLELVRLEFELKQAKSDASASLNSDSAIGDPAVPSFSEVTRRFPGLRSVPELEQTIARTFGSKTPEAPSEDATQDFYPGRIDDSARSDSRPNEPSEPSTQDMRLADHSTQGGHAGVRAALQPGASFGDYELISEIARGGMGVVFKARQKKLNRLVALKMILSGQLASAEEVRRFYSEAEAAAKLDHPGIVPIHEVNEIEGQPFFSMGFVDGASLSESLRDGPLPVAEATDLMIRVAEAVEYAHQHGIVHRDLKPGNILLTVDGQPKVTDFGLAKTVEGDSGLTATGQILGTPSYMPPEQAAGQLDAVGPASDVYALGAVLYCLLTGRPPFQSANVVETVRQVLEKEPVAPRLLNPAVDRDLQTICLKCLEKDPRSRFASAQEVADELKRYLNGEPIRSRRIGPVTRAVRWCRRKPLVAGLGLAMLLLILVSVAAWSFSQTAREVRHLAALRAAFESRVDAPELTQTYLDDMDQLLVEIGQVLPEEAEEGRQRLNQQMLRSVQEQILRPRLDDQDAERIETAIALIERRGEDAATRAQQLREDLERRLSGWAERLALESPFEQRERLFQVQQVQIDGDALRLVEPLPEQTGNTIQPFLPLLAESNSTVRFRADFDAGWRDASQFGLVLDGTAQRAYVFLLRLPKDVNGPSRGANPKRRALDEDTMETYSSGQAIAEIRKNGTVQQRELIPLAELPEGPISLLVTRNRDQLSFQIEQRSPLEFRDVFAFGTTGDGRGRSTGKLGIVWPQEAGLRRLSIYDRRVPPEPSDLQLADQHYDQQRFEDALNVYRELALTSSDPAVRQEAEYKQGICLLRLNRDVDARQVFEPLFAENGDPWPILAGCQLWLGYIREQNDAAAESIYQALSTRYRFEQLATLLPRDVRDEIVESYLGEIRSLSRLLQYNPQRTRDIERAAAIDRFLSADGHGNRWIQIELSRAYRYIGELEPALQITEEQAERYGDATLVRLYSRMLRLTGAPEKALEKVNEGIERYRAERPDLPVGLIVERSRVYAALERWLESESDIDFLLMNQDGLEPRWLTYTYLIKGFLRAREGELARARRLWAKGYERSAILMQEDSPPSSETINVLILGSLGGNLEMNASERFLGMGLGASSDSGNNALVRMAKTVLAPSSFHNALKAMWQTPFGLKRAENFAFERYTLQQRVRVPLQLAVLEFVRQHAFQGALTNEQEQIVWQLTQDSFDAMVVNGTIQGPQVVQLGLSWKGTTNVLGWAGVAPTLAPSIRWPAAYVLAHRYLQRGEPAQTRNLLQQVTAAESEFEELAALARQDLQCLDDQAGVLVLVNHSPSTVTVDIQTTGATAPAEEEGMKSVTLKPHEQAAIQLPVGEYRLRLPDQTEPSSLKQLARTKLRLNVLQRALVDVSVPGSQSTSTSLPGLVTGPARTSAEAPWQLLRRHDPEGRSTPAWHPSGQRVAIGGEEGTVRVYSTEGKLLHALPGHSRRVEDVDWQSSGRLLASGGHDREVRLWEHESGKLVRVLAAHRNAISDLQWSPDDSLLAVSDWDGVIALWDVARLEPRRLEGHPGGTAQIDWHPSQRLLASAGYRDGTVRIWDADSQQVAKSLGPFQELRTVAWSPDGGHLAVGTETELIVLNNSDWSRQYHAQVKGRLANIDWVDEQKIMGAIDGWKLTTWNLTESDSEDERIRNLQHVRDFAVSPDRTRIALTSYKSGVRIIEAAGDGGPIRDWEGGVPVPSAVAWSPGANRLAVGHSHSGLWLVDRDAHTVKRVELPESQAVHRLHWSPDAKLLAASGQNGHTFVLGIETDKVVQLERQEVRAEDIIWIGPAELVTVGKDQAVRVWKPLERTDPVSVANTDEPLMSVAWDATRSILMAGDFEAGLHLFDVGKDKHSLTAGRVLSLNGVEKISRLEVSSSGRHALIGDDWLTYPVFELIGKDSRTLEVVRGARNDLKSSARKIAWSPEGDRFAAGGEYGTMNVWALTGNKLADLVGHDRPIVDLAWSDQNGLLASVTSDRTLRLWNGTTGKELETWVLLPHDQYVVLSPAGKVLSHSEDALRHLVRLEKSSDGSLKISDLE